MSDMIALHNSQRFTAIGSSLIPKVKEKNLLAAASSIPELTLTHA
jgi:hypothetical protein